MTRSQSLQTHHDYMTINLMDAVLEIAHSKELTEDDWNKIELERDMLSALIDKRKQENE